MVNIPKKLLDKALEDSQKIFKETGLFFFPEVVIQTWNPYAVSDHTAFKTYWLLRNAKLRMEPNGEIKVEDFTSGHYLTEEVAKAISEALGVSIYPVEHTDIYDTKLEYNLAHKPLEIPRDIEVDGIIIRKGEPLLETTVYRAIQKFSPDKPLTEQAIISLMTDKPPYGGGWIAKTPQSIKLIKQAIHNLVESGSLFYDPSSNGYSITYRGTREGTTKIG